MYCQNCGASLSEGSIYCNKCGTKYEEGPKKEEPAPDPATNDDGALLVAVLAVLILGLYFIFTFRILG